MSSRTFTVLVRITGDTGITDAQAIAAINDDLSRSGGRITMFSLESAQVAVTTWTCGHGNRHPMPAPGFAMCCGCIVSVGDRMIDESGAARDHQPGTPCPAGEPRVDREIKQLPPDGTWGIEFRNGRFLQSLEADNSGPWETAMKFTTGAEADAFMDKHPWIAMNGGMPLLMAPVIVAGMVVGVSGGHSVPVTTTPAPWEPPGGYDRPPRGPRRKRSNKR